MTFEEWVNKGIDFRKPILHLIREAFAEGFPEGYEQCKKDNNEGRMLCHCGREMAPGKCPVCDNEE